MVYNYIAQSVNFNLRSRHTTDIVIIKGVENM